jgi:hypothetical protein
VFDVDLGRPERLRDGHERSSDGRVWWTTAGRTAAAATDRV